MNVKDRPINTIIFGSFVILYGEYFIVTSQKDRGLMMLLKISTGTLRGYPEDTIVQVPYKVKITIE